MFNCLQRVELSSTERADLTFLFRNPYLQTLASDSSTCKCNETFAMYSTHIYLLAVYDIHMSISHARSKIHTVLNNDMIIMTFIIFVAVVVMGTN